MKFTSEQIDFLVKVLEKRKAKNYIQSSVGNTIKIILKQPDIFRNNVIDEMIESIRNVDK